jgi:dienelactone hydrolase
MSRDKNWHSLSRAISSLLAGKTRDRDAVMHPAPMRRPIRGSPWLSSLLVGIAVLLGAAACRAGTLVEFPNLAEHLPKTLPGYLARPGAGLSALLGSGSNRTGPFPAVIVLHGCSGLSSHSARIADRLGSWGYVALTVDSLGPRGMATHCGGGLFVDQAFDAYAALRYVSQLDFVDGARVAVIGQSMGGSSVLYAVDRDLAAQYFNERFRAAIAYYPGCAIPAASLTAPTLVLIGEADDWNSAERCRQMVAHSRPDGAPIALTVYPGAYHAFDVAELNPGRNSLGHWLEYNEPAAKDAEQKVRDFLAANLGVIKQDATAEK